MSADNYTYVRPFKDGWTITVEFVSLGVSPLSNTHPGPLYNDVVKAIRGA